MTLEPYYYPTKSKRPPRMDKNRTKGFSAATDLRELTGWVHGKKASDLEERTYRGSKNVGLKDDQIHFQVPFQTMLPFRKTLDFVLVPAKIMPLEVDGPMGHTNSAQQGADSYREALLNAEFMKMGWHFLTRVKWHELSTQFRADRKMREILR